MSSTPSNKLYTGIEHRSTTRHPVTCKVKVIAENKISTFGFARNLSQSGVFVVTEGLNLRKNSVVELIFVLNMGTLQKVHRRKGRVVHVTGGGTGFEIIPNQ